MLSCIVAVYRDWGIGADGTQPVALHADRRRFAQLTRGAAVIVGRRTLADFPGGRPLKGRVNIVLSRRGIAADGIVPARSVEEAVRAAAEHDKAFVIGGASVYRVMLPYCDEVYVTKVDAQPVSDSFFPDLDADPAWTVAEAEEPAQEDGISYRFLRYVRQPAEAGPDMQESDKAEPEPQQPEKEEPRQPAEAEPEPQQPEEKETDRAD